MDLHIALVHHPVLNRNGETVTTALTNLDLHDLARTGRTYDVTHTWFVTPGDQQRLLMERIVNHWQKGEGPRYNPIRSEAFKRVRVAHSIEEIVEELRRHSTTPLRVVGTGASLTSDTISYATLRDAIATEEGTVLLLFGTGWGLVDEVLKSCDFLLPGVHAVPSRAGYNHLPVRAAVAIILDRLTGDQLDSPA